MPSQSVRYEVGARGNPRPGIIAGSQLILELPIKFPDENDLESWVIPQGIHCQSKKKKTQNSQPQNDIPAGD